MEQHIGWYAIYTKSRAEKRTAQLLEERGFQVFLPLVKSIRQWSDRKKIIYEPLFKSYLFVKINLQDQYKVLSTTGAAWLVRIGREIIEIPENQIEAIKAFLGQENEYEHNLNHLQKGTKVTVTHGALKGLSGTLVQVNNRKKLQVQIEAVNQNLLISVPEYLLKINTQESALAY